MALILIVVILVVCRQCWPVLQAHAPLVVPDQSARQIQCSYGRPGHVDDDEMLMVLRGLGLEIIDVGGARDDEWDELEHKEDAQLAVLQAIRLDEKAEQHVRGDEQLAKLRRVSVNG